MCKKPEKPTKLLNAKALCFALVLIAALSNTSFGQGITWQRILSNNYGTIKKVQQTNDGGYVGVGSDRINNVYKIYFTKLDASGNNIWTRIIGIGYAHAFEVEETNDYGFVIGGYSDSAVGNAKVYLVKTDSTGNIEWQRYYINSDLDQCYCVKQTSDNGYILGCRTQVGILNEILLIKTDSFGNLQWQRVYSSFPRHSNVRDIEILPNGYLICGTIYDNGAGTSDAYILKVNQNGDSVWAKIYNGGSSDIIYSSELLGNYGFLFGGYSSSFNINHGESYLIKTDTSGSIIWQRTYSGNYEEECNTVKYKSSMGYILAGYTDTNSIQYTRAMIKVVDTNGIVIRQQTYLPASNGSWFNDIELTLDGGYILGGGADVNTTSKMYIAKTDSLLEATPIGINLTNQNVPTKFEMTQNYPNPFNPITNFKVYLNKSTNLQILVFDITGKRVMELINKLYNAGNHLLSIDFQNINLSSGIYFYSAFLNNSTIPISTKKIIFLK